MITVHLLCQRYPIDFCLNKKGSTDSILNRFTSTIADDPQHCHPIPYYRYLTVPPPIRSKRSSAERSVSKEPSIPKTIGNELDQLAEEPVIQKSEIYLEIDSNSTVVEV